MDAILEFFSGLPRELYVLVISMLPIVELRGAIPVGASLDIPFYLNYVLAVFGNLLPVPFILYFITKFMDFLARFRIFRPMINWIRRKANKHSSKVIKEDAPTASAEKCGNEACGNGTTANTSESAEASINAAESSEASIAAAESAEVLECSADTAKKQPSEISEQSGDDPAEQAKNSSAPTSPRKMTRAIFIALVLFVAIPFPGTGAWTGSLIAALFNLPKKRSLLAVTAGVLLSGVIMTLASYGVVGFLGIFT